MSLPAAMQYPETGHHSIENTAASPGNLSAADDSNSEVEDDEEEEDMDFNPFLREEISSEASSSLSSENEGPSDNIEKSLRSSQKFQNTSTSSRPADDTQGCQYAVNAELIMTQAMDEEFRETDDISQNCTRLHPISSTLWERSQVSIAGVREVSSSGDGDYASNESMKEILLGQTKSCLTLHQKTSVQIDEEDAICRRTRARHSLANYTLEELETFLQESDDDGDRQNVNDEEEYHKFLAAVLLEGVDRGQAVDENVNLDDDEENDADFVLELEEALESDIDERPRKIERRGSNQEGGAYRPQTRQKKGLKESSKGKNYLLEQAKVPILPILPNVSNAQSTPVPTFPWKLSPPKIFSNCTSPQFGTELINGFTAYQIGQLYRLVYEHVQLLVQVFSVCVLDPSRQEVAMEVQKMIVEMIDKRNDALSWRVVPYPASCFHHPNLSSPLNFGFHQATKCSMWTPLIDNPVRSVLDVPPLALAKSYMNDVSATVLAHRQRHLECSGNQNSLQRAPLFSLPMLASASGTNDDTLGGIDPMIKNTVQPLPSCERQPKKSLASTIVENTMKKSVALVPQDIANLAQIFFPLFNSSLFPHKPPLASVANRVLFTDAEDRLLAMGLMNYNNDWMAIQKHFLPCKSQHQIFVRQKNRSSSKAPENPIKAVRRLKTSPLTADEMALINEGLRIFKHDWLMIGKSCVPHRDPSLLPRQWQVATGTQKSYSTSEISKCKRRLYEAKRRQLKASAMNCQSLLGEEVSNREHMEGGNIDVESEAYIHEAFLADAETRNCKRVPYDILLSSVHPNNVLSSKMTCMDTEISKKHSVVTAGCSESQEINAAAHDIMTSSNSTGDINPVSHIFHANCSLPSAENLVSNLILRIPTGNLCSLPRHMRKSKGKLVVKLAPGLPPVNLPQSVRVLSKSAFKSYNIRSSYSKTGDNATKSNLHSSSQVSREGTVTSELVNHINMFRKNGPNIDKEETSSEDRFMMMNDASESDLNMHPLLFQASEDQFSSYYSVNSNASSTYNFFPEVPVQAESNLFRPQSSVGNIRDTHFEAPPLSLRTIDFHPLLQRAGNVTDEYAITSTAVGQFSGDLEIVEGNCNSSVNHSILRAPLVDDHHVATETAYRGHLSKEKLDLEIHLCSANNNQKTTGNLETGEHQCAEETICRLENRLSEKDLRSDRLFPNSKDKYSGISVWNNSTAKSKRSSSSLEVLSSNGDSCLLTEDSHGEPACDIVMEQEELSDSEEEIQHVEFECEEMDDSEGEGSDNEPPCENQTKQLLSTHGERNAGISRLFRAKESGHEAAAYIMGMVHFQEDNTRVVGVELLNMLATRCSSCSSNCSRGTEPGQCLILHCRRKATSLSWCKTFWKLPRDMVLSSCENGAFVRVSERVWIPTDELRRTFCSPLCRWAYEYKMLMKRMYHV